MFGGLGLAFTGVLILVPCMGPDTNVWLNAAPLLFYELGLLYELGLGFASAEATGRCCGREPWPA
ncbi:hypothetical protein D9543_06015 [Corynebacterium macginleyi]|uniref:Uncharacterized protein n=1 Tax=Corynebacterium macginleyi TaxID=38290 RepID=A0A3M0GQN6_9CORY|nr:hypothetical protein D9543_06015 [Corynebacterium macginleyi]RMB66800.1 hypothetical protein D9V82_05210 [Corynebacterium macginleyi]RMB67719.1 hypothetical protein D9542_06465 [Corynebacterium macginleyi]